MTRAQWLVSWLLTGIACSAFGQTGSQLTEPPQAPPSRWQQDKEALDQAMRARALTANEPRDLWVSGQLETGDPWAQVSALAQARTRVPGDKLFLGSLAVACLVPMQPLAPECDATDRLADWATRDDDNGVQVLLLANRARLRNNPAAMIAFLEEAATRPRFDDYQGRGALLWWEAVRAVPGTVDPAARAELAASYALARRPYALSQMQLLCSDASRLPDNVRSACASAGAALAQRGANWSLRIAGARLAERTVAPGAAYATAQQRVIDLQRRAFECAEAGNAVAQAFESPDAAVRARAVAQWEARLALEARVGEVAACETKG